MNGIKWGYAEKIPGLRNAIIVGGGRSLSGFDFEQLRGLGHIITVNYSGKLIPFADSWFTLDPWGLEGPQLPPEPSRAKLYAAVPDDFGTLHARSKSHRVAVHAPITFLHRLISHNLFGVPSDTAYRLGLSEDNGCINSGNSGYGALNLAYHFHAERVFLLGIDGDIGYHYTTKKQNRPLRHLPRLFASTIPQLEARGMKVFNASINSTIDCFPRMTLEDALSEMRRG